MHLESPVVIATIRSSVTCVINYKKEVKFVGVLSIELIMLQREMNIATGVAWAQGRQNVVLLPRILYVYGWIGGGRCMRSCCLFVEECLEKVTVGRYVDASI